VTSSNLADALLAIAETYLAGQITTASDPEIYQVIIHAGTDALPRDTPAASSEVVARDRVRPGVSAETAPAPPVPGYPADPARCHVEDGPAISITTAQMITCTAALRWLLHDRDHGRCRFPGCESRRTDLHHIQYWANGGPTDLDNLINLCPAHHMLLHDRGYLIATGSGGTFTFYRPDGTLLPSSPRSRTRTGVAHHAGRRCTRRPESDLSAQLFIDKIEHLFICRRVNFMIG